MKICQAVMVGVDVRLIGELMGAGGRVGGDGSAPECSKVVK